MKFSEMLVRLHEGMKGRRPEWKDTLFAVMRDGKIKLYTNVVSYFDMPLDVITSNGWVVIDKPETEYYFWEAFDLLTAGKKIKFKEWQDRHLEYNLIDKQLVLHHVEESVSRIWFNDCLAEDWEVIT